MLLGDLARARCQQALDVRMVQQLPGGVGELPPGAADGGGGGRRVVAIGQVSLDERGVAGCRAGHRAARLRLRLSAAASVSAGIVCP